MCFQIIAKILNFGHKGFTSLVKSAISRALNQNKKNKPSFAPELSLFCARLKIGVANWRERMKESAPRKHFNSSGRL
jgi:hypothetical protein